MGKFIKQGRVVLLLTGRQAGKKAIVVRTSDEGTKERKYGHALVAGIERYPRKVTRRMGQKKILKRTNIKPFVKYVNLNHVMPTRYQVAAGDIDLKEVVKDDKLSEPDKRQEMKKQVKSIFHEKYRTLPIQKSAADKSSNLRFFFKKLRF